MFVPVACSQCGKPFQVPDAAIGQPTPCPWCRAAVLALPIPPENKGLAPPARPVPTPLSLDDEPVKRSQGALGLVLVVLVLVGVAATAGTIGVLRHKEGYFASREWRPYTAPDNSCSLDMLGRPNEDPDAPESGSRRYMSEGWYSGTSTWIGWRNLTAAEAQIANTKDAWHNPQLVKILDGERDRVKGHFGGYVAKDGTITFIDKGPLTREIRLELPHGRLVERMIVAPTGPNPRVYFLGIAGKRLDPDGPEVKRFFDSFRPSE